MPRTHTYQTDVVWTGNRGSGTTGYRDYDRSYTVAAEGKPSIAGSSDPTFRGDRTRWNPEDLLLAALSACHQLAYLHLCADAGVVVTGYHDRAEGIMQETADGGGRFTAVTLRPAVTITAESDSALAVSLHHEAHAKCFIANSVNFPVNCEASLQIADPVHQL